MKLLLILLLIPIMVLSACTCAVQDGVVYKDCTPDITFCNADSGLAYGEIWYMGAGFDTGLALQDTWYQISGFASNGESNDTIPDHTNNHITIENDGMYLVSFSISARSGARNTYHFMIFTNDGTVSYMNNMCHRDTANAGRLGVVAATGICRLYAGDTLELWVERVDGLANLKTITIEHIILNATLIGG